MTKDESLKLEKLELDIFRLQCCIWLLFVLSIMNSIKDLI